MGIKVLDNDGNTALYDEPFEHIYIDDLTWTTKDNVEMPFYDMVDKHLVNVFNLLISHNATIPYALYLELRIRNLLEDLNGTTGA